MKVGVLYPVPDPHGDPSAVHKVGVAAEELGYDHLMMADHVLGAPHEDRHPPFGPHLTEKHPFHDPLIAFAYLAGITKRITFVTGVIILPQRQTVLVAKQLADLSLLSGGRIHLGVGSGWNYVEYQALGVEWSKRGKIFAEQIPYLRRLWTEDVVSIDGQFHQLDRGGINPRPRQPIPIYLGGHSDIVLRRAARLADGLIFTGDIGGALTALARMRDILAEEGRSEESFSMNYCMPPASVELPPTRGGGWVGGGRDADSILDMLNTWREANGDSATISSIGMRFTSVDQHIELMAEVSQRWNT